MIRVAHTRYWVSVSISSTGRASVVPSIEAAIASAATTGSIVAA
jgi:hypothetical protein